MTRRTWQNLAATALVADASLQAHWNRLNAGQRDFAFMSAQSIAISLAVFGQGQERLLIGSRQGQIDAMLVLLPEGWTRWRSFQPSQLPLGAFVTAPSVTLQDLARSLMRGPLAPCMALSITQIDPLLAPRQDDATDSGHSDYIATPWLEISGSFDDYWALRGKNLRQNLRKQRNRLAAEGTTVAMQVLRAPEDMAGAIARYGALESGGWKATEGTAIHPDNPQGRFYTQLLQDAASRGEAVVYEYRFNDRTVASNLCLLRKGVLVVLKTTYDETIPKSLSPAFLLREDELKHFFAGTEVRRVEYFGRRMDWHTKLTDQQRTLYHLTAYRWPLVKRLAEWRRPPAAVAPAESVASALDTTQT